MKCMTKSMALLGWLDQSLTLFLPCTKSHHAVIHGQASSKCLSGHWWLFRLRDGQATQVHLPRQAADKGAGEVAQLKWYRFLKCQFHGKHCVCDLHRLNHSLSCLLAWTAAERTARRVGHACESAMSPSDTTGSLGLPAVEEHT